MRIWNLLLHCTVQNDVILSCKDNEEQKERERKKQRNCFMMVVRVVTKRNSSWSLVVLFLIAIPNTRVGFHGTNFRLLAAFIHGDLIAQTLGGGVPLLARRRVALAARVVIMVGI